MPIKGQSPKEVVHTGIKCGHCRVAKSFEAFYKSKNGGRRSWCIECCREYHKDYFSKNGHHLREKSTARTKLLREMSAGRPRPLLCEVCERPSSKGVCFDHDHKTKLFRGWLCHRCNSALGLLDDNPALLKKLADYLETFVPTHKKRIRLIPAIGGMDANRAN